MSVETAPPAGSHAVRRPNRFLAATLGLFFSGVGALYAGRPGRAFLWFGTKALFTVTGLGMLGLAHTPTLRAGSLLFIVAGGFALPVLCAVDSWRVASRPPLGIRQTFQRLPVVGVAVVLYLAANLGLKEVVLQYAAARLMLINGAWMVPTILDSERVVVRTLDRSQPLERGTLVTYSPPGGTGGRFLGRLVALPNDTLEVIDNRLVVNGRREGLYTGQRNHGASEAELKALSDITHEMRSLRVPDGSVFILGDNRANSRDSRHFGAVPISNLTATVGWWAWKRDPDGSVAWTSIGHDVEPYQP